MKLHHIGFVVAKLEQSIENFRENYSLDQISDIIIDPIQKVRVVFLSGNSGSELPIELIEPLSADSPVTKFLKKGGGLHHLAYEVKDIYKVVEDISKKKGGIILCEPVQASGHGGRFVSFLYMPFDCPGGYIVEFVEKSNPKK